MLKERYLDNNFGAFLVYSTHSEGNVNIVAFPFFVNL